jgi:hypothetical protein
VRITGGFSCRPPQFGSFGDVVKPGAARFVASSLLPAAAGAAQGTIVLAGGPDSAVKVDPCSQLARAVQAMVPAAGARPVDPIRQAILAAPIEARRIGTWIGETVHVAHPTGRFDATTDGMGQGQVVRWQVDGTGLAGADGDVDLGGGVAAKYHLAGKSLVLTMTADHAVEMLLSVTVVDDAGQAVSSERCVRYEPECKGEGRLTPMWSEYQAAWLSHFGVAEVGKVKSDALTLG